MPIRVVPVTLKQANAFVREHHRHHGPVAGHRFAIGAQQDDRLVGVAIVARPVARRLDDGRTAEITRLCSDGTANICSFLLARCRRIAKDMGFLRLYTYTLASEQGTSLRAAGWVLEGRVRGGSWSRSCRPRTDRHPTEDKHRWRAA